MGIAGRTWGLIVYLDQHRSITLTACLLLTLLLIQPLMVSTVDTRSSTEVPDVIISEVAWAGTAADENGQWMELHNSHDTAVDLSGWAITSVDGLNIALSGTIPANGFFLLEGFSDGTIIDVPASQIYTGLINAAGTSLSLKNITLDVVDTANIDGGPWPAGSASPDYQSMERASPEAADDDSSWVSNSVIRNGMDYKGNPIAGTPGQANSSWASPEGVVDLMVELLGPSTAASGSTFDYRISYQNKGDRLATEVVLSDTLPDGIVYISDNSGLTLISQQAKTLQWSIGEIEPGSQGQFDLKVKVEESTSGTRINLVAISGKEEDDEPSNNTASLAVNVIGQSEALILIDAALYDGYELNDADEAVYLVNIGSGQADLSGWKLTDNTSYAVFPSGTSISPGAGIWVTKSAAAFRKQFGFDPDYESAGSDPQVPAIDGSWPGFSNEGDEVVLMNSEGHIIDALVYEGGLSEQSGWSGPALYPYKVSGLFAEEGQILYRKRNSGSGRPVADTNSAADWAQSKEDIYDGRKVRYPGWDVDQFYFFSFDAGMAEVKVAISPDNSFEALSGEIANAKSSIYIETHTFRSYPAAKTLVDAAKRGLEVIVLLEGAPVGGLEDAERLNCQQLEEVGGQCWFMIRDDSKDIHDRYRYLHAKFMIIDGQRVIISSENLSPSSLPNDLKSDGTLGRRGVFIATNAPGIVQGLQSVWDSDFDPQNHQDLFRWSAGHPVYGSPPAGTEPITITGGTEYPLKFPEYKTFSDARDFVLEQSPENSLRSDQGTIALIAQAGSGDVVLAQQLMENLHWGPGNSGRQQDPNPRLEAMIAAAQRGARVRVMLDGFYDSGGENQATCTFLNQIAQEEKLDLACMLANPTGEGIHNKMILLQVNGKGYVHVGSINGSELSHKGNREAALLFQSNQTFQYLEQLFVYDWPHDLYMPIVNRDYLGRADHILISEVYYDPPGMDDAEFIEVVNPTGGIIDLGSYSIGDALQSSDFEDVRRFPAPTEIIPGQTKVIAFGALAFFDQFGQLPDFEIVETDPRVPNLIDDPDWGDPAALLQLGNQGDEVILRDTSGLIIDALAYGMGRIQDQPSCPLVIASGRSLERNPYWRDWDDCPKDFLNWSQPTPGIVREIVIPPGSKTD